MNYRIKKYALILFTLTLFSSPMLAQTKDLLFSFCNFGLPEEVKQSNTSFSELFRFTIDENGKLQNPKRILGKYVDELTVQKCVEKWIFYGFKSGSKANVLFYWKHGNGWQGTQVSSKGFYRVVKDQSENSDQ